MKRYLSPLIASFALTTAACKDEVGVVQLHADIAVAPELVDFGPVQLATTSERQILITNTGDALLRLKDVTPAPSFDPAFSFTLESTSVVSGGSVALTVQFAPAELGTKRSSIFVNPDDPELDPIEVVLSGEGVRPRITVTPQALAFGNVLLGTTKTLPISITNNGMIDARIELVTETNVKRCSATSQPGAFCVRDALVDADSKIALEAGATITLDVELGPTLPNVEERGTFTLSACEGEGCRTEVSLTGTGVESGFLCNPRMLDFGAINPGSCVTEVVRCSNIANERITVLEWGASTAGGGTSADFSFEASEIQVLNEGEYVDIDVTYCPAGLGDDEGGLSVETDNIDPRRRFVLVTLAGEGGGPNVTVVPDLLNFGLATLVTPARRALLVQNVGSAPLTLMGIDPDRERTGAFRLANPVPSQMIPPGGAIDVLVDFQPTIEGLVTSELVIRSDDRDQPELAVTLLGEGVSLPPCSYEIAPSSLSFGVVEVDRFLSRGFEIRNLGADDCLLMGARFLNGSDSEFSLPEGEPRSVRIAAGSSATLRVEYAPTTIGTHLATLEISISDPLQPFREVPISGTAADGGLLIIPNDLDFGTIGVGCSSRERTITIYNTSTTDAEVTSILPAEPVSAAFTILNLPSPLPMTLPPGASTSFDVVFHADNQASYAGALEVEARYSGSPALYIISLQGMGDFNAARIDHFKQLEQPLVDVLFVIDDSGSMSQEQAALATNFDAFIQFANALGLDYQIGVTTTDIGTAATAESGRLVPLTGGPAERIVTPNSLPTPEELFAQNVAVGTAGNATEKGLEAAYLALTQPLIGGHNAGLIRPDAVLSIIIVSDEEDSSAQSVGFYMSFFQSIKGFRRTELFTLSAIVGNAMGGCTGPGGTATAGVRYTEAARMTNGVVQSICTSDWATALEQLSTSAFGFRSSFILTNQAVASTIQVFVDEVAIPAVSPTGTNNWGYDGATNSINFAPLAVPQPGAEMRVEYVVECL